MLTIKESNRLFVDDEPTGEDEKFWRPIHLVADRVYYEIRRIWLGVFLDLRDRMKEVDVVQTLLRGGEIEIGTLTGRILAEMEPGITRQLSNVLTGAVVRSAQVSTLATEEVLQQLIPDARISVTISPVNPTTLSWISQFVGQQITEINSTTLENVRNIVRRGFQEVKTIDAIARDLRDFIGLTTRQAKALARARQVMAEEGISPRRIEELIARKGRRMLRERARLISRTESIHAVSAGAHLNFISAEQQGLWDPRFKRYWVVARDERLCPICSGIPVLNPNGVGLHEPFRTSIGPILHPTAHPACRCSIAIRATELSEGA